jgi:hypothetical protein
MMVITWPAETTGPGPKSVSLYWADGKAAVLLGAANAVRAEFLEEHIVRLKTRLVGAGHPLDWAVAVSLAADPEAPVAAEPGKAIDIAV